MELRVWVDGTQRVVCGVKLTTTCQEIVFALAHATQQAGRFTMIERWRNNERLLSPNEQPLVTLQRWGDRMNEVEFILRKTCTDTMPPQHRPLANDTQASHQQQITSNMPNPHTSSSVSQHNAAILTNTPAGSVVSKQSSQHTSDNNPNNRQATLNGNCNHDSSTSNQPPIAQPQQALAAHQILNDQTHDNLYQQQRQFNLSRRPQTSLGPLTSSNSALNIASNSNFPQITGGRLTNAFRPSLSSSALPNSSSNGNSAPHNNMTMMRTNFIENRTISPSLYSNPPNGYPFQNDVQRYQQANSNQVTKNYPYEDLYSTINKKRTNQPPAVPAKPKLVNNLPLSAQQSLNNAQINYYQPNQSPVHMFATNPRARHPPGYMEYLEAMANRNSLPASLMTNTNLIRQSQNVHSNIFSRNPSSHPFYDIQQQNGSSPVSSLNGKHHYLQNQQISRTDFSSDINQPPANHLSHLNPKLIESGFVINRGSAVNIKLSPNGHIFNTGHTSMEETRQENKLQTKSSSLSQMGLDMLKVIEEQKKLLLNQKNELDRLDHDQEYIDAKQSSEQAEIVNRIEKEIAQLETLWRENQAQIRRLESQDFEKELEQLKLEQVRMEQELDVQRGKLALFESDIAQCKNKIELLESELDRLGINGADTDGESADDEDVIKKTLNDSVTNSHCDSTNSDLKSYFNVNRSERPIVIANNPSTQVNEADDDSGGEGSDDSNPEVSRGKIRSAKDVAYVDKRGLICGIRSLKLDRGHNRSNEKINSIDGNNARTSSNTPVNNHLIMKDKVSVQKDESPTAGVSTTEANGDSEQEPFVPETNSLNDKTAYNNINNNKHEFLMTL